jgi:hypothetical protein
MAGAATGAYGWIPPRRNTHPHSRSRTERAAFLVLHRLLDHNTKNPDLLEQFPLLARHGLRSSAAALRIRVGNHRVHADTTALMLANFVGVLDHVERVLGPMHISPELVPALVGMLEHAAPHQPSHLATSREVLRLLDQGACRAIPIPNAEKEMPAPLPADRGTDWDAALQAARATGGYVVDFLRSISSKRVSIWWRVLESHSTRPSPPPLT